jgi:hypothetical protein
MSQIKDCILGRQKTAFKFKWKYKIIWNILKKL